MPLSTPASCLTPSFYNTATHRLQEQLSVPGEERSSHSAPTAYGSLPVPSFNRAFSWETGNYYVAYSEGACFKRKVSKKAEQIISRFEKMRMDSDESVITQSPSPVAEEEEIQYPIPEASQPMTRLQRQFSEFPLDEVF